MTATEPRRAAAGADAGSPRAAHLLALAWCAATACASVGAQADSDDAERARRLTEAGAILPLEQVLQHAAREQPGRVIEVELDRDDDRYVYEIEIVDPEGRVWELELDAANGELLDRESEDD